MSYMRIESPTTAPPIDTPPDAAALDTAAETSPGKAATEPDKMQLLQRIATLVIILVPFVGLIVAMALVWGRGFDWVNLGLLIGMYLFTGLGVTIGFHRLFTHRSFATSRAVTATLGVMGSMAVEGPLFHWVAFHRSHHQHSDKEHDPHSPHTFGGGLWNMTRGLWRSHAGWLFKKYPSDLERYVGDLKADRLLRVVSGLFPLWVLLGLVIPTALGGLITLSWSGALLGLLWGGLVRIFFVHHVTWSINSVCHIWGSRPFDTRDQSRNNVFFGVFGFGEGWHNNHHAFPNSARHGLRWFQIDTSYLIIWCMSKLGLAWKVNVPTSQRIAAKLR